MLCIVCGTGQSAGLARWHAMCPACGYESAALQVAINQRPAAGGVDEDEREIGLKALRLENFRQIVRMAAEHARPGERRLLDVGCAHGWFLETARAYFDVLGLEPDEVVGQRAAARGLPVRHGYFPEALAADERFDAIVFNDVIEHIPDIHAALKACNARLKADGLLILNLPNSRGFFYRLSKLFAKAGWSAPFERLWQKDLPSPHVHYFGPDNLTQLVQAHGLAPVLHTELPALRARGLLERLRCAGNVPALSLYTQYIAILCAIPLLRAFPSDIIVSVFRKQDAAQRP